MRRVASGESNSGSRASSSSASSSWSYNLSGSNQLIIHINIEVHRHSRSYFSLYFNLSESLIVNLVSTIISFREKVCLDIAAAVRVGSEVFIYYSICTSSKIGIPSLVIVSRSTTYEQSTLCTPTLCLYIIYKCNIVYLRTHSNV